MGETVWEGRTVPYLVMELLRGSPLSTALGEGRQLPLAEVAGWGGQICRALSSAHAAGVVHRDLKPDNLWLDESGEIKVLDFGIAGFVRPAESQTLTAAGSLLGTYACMDPEYARTGRAEERSDLYALGCVLYEMVCGRRPFQAPEDCCSPSTWSRTRSRNDAAWTVTASQSAAC